MISVILCTRDRFPLAIACINSLLSQAGNYEMIVVDQSAKRMAYPADPRLKIIYSDCTGLSLARNIGIRNAQGDVFAFIDDDTLVSDNYIDELTKVFEKSDIHAIAGKALIRETGIPYTKVHSDTVQDLSFRNWNRLLGMNMAIRRSIVERVGFFDEKLGAGTKWSSGEETDYFFRMKYIKSKVYYEPRVIVSHPNEEYGHSSSSYCDKLYAYGKGNGALFAKHLFHYKKPVMLLFFLLSLTKPAVRIVQYGLTLQLPKLRQQRSILFGRIAGFLEAAAGKGGVS